MRVSSELNCFQKSNKAENVKKVALAMATIMGTEVDIDYSAGTLV